MTILTLLKPRSLPKAFLAVIAAVISGFMLNCGTWERYPPHLAFVSTVAGLNGELGETFGIAVKGEDIYVSDGVYGVIWMVKEGTVTRFAEGLDTPSGIAFTKSGDLVVADTGSHSIKAVSSTGDVRTISGTDGKSGFADGASGSALFNGPIGVAASDDGKIFVSDTYNDRIRIIENGTVRTLAGGAKGFRDAVGTDARFDTPCGVALWQDKVLVADHGNRRIRVVEPDGRVWTLAGTGEEDLRDGLPASASFVAPTAVTVGPTGSILVADGNAIREIGGLVPVVRTITGHRRGLIDGSVRAARFNRPSGLALDANGALLVADSDDRLLRRISAEAGPAVSTEQIEALRDKPERFRKAQPARWPYDPPTVKREIAGTLGELRGEVGGGNETHFHNGLDIAGAYGETAKFIRSEKVLLPSAADNFGTLRELLRMPTLGYIHIRLGRDQNSRPFDDARFQFIRDDTGKIVDVRVPRGASFKAGEAVGTLNAMNHVHLVAGRSGQEMNAIDALELPGLTDSRPPMVENVFLYDEQWRQLETEKAAKRIKLPGKTRIVVRAYDQADGNAARRRLGLYRLGYSLFADGQPESQPNWTIVFDRMPDANAVELVYGPGSRSGATGETIFNYIVSNSVEGDHAEEGFIDPSSLQPGDHTLRVFAADYFGNITHEDVIIEVVK